VDACSQTELRRSGDSTYYDRDVHLVKDLACVLVGSFIRMINDQALPDMTNGKKIYIDMLKGY
jgi:hypothetical protein